MKTFSLFCCLFTFLLVSRAYVLTDYEVKCGQDSGLNNITSEDVHWYTECPETAPENFKDFILCTLKAERVLNKNGFLNNDKFDEANSYSQNMFRVLRRIKIEVDKGSYALKIHKLIYQALFHKIPTFCKDRKLNEAWTNCRISSNYSEFNMDELDELILSEEEPPKEFKTFIMCGLTKERFLTGKGTLFKPKVQLHALYRHYLKELYSIPSEKNKEEYAWKVFKIMYYAE